MTNVGAGPAAPARVAPAAPVRSRTTKRNLLVCRLGIVDYQEAWDLQRRLAAKRAAGQIPDILLLLQHPHTYTLGRRGRRENILLTPDELSKKGIAVYEVDRGGDVTYHGPGQLVGYPILKLPSRRLDFVRYIRDLERSLLEATRDLGAPAELKPSFSGVWHGNQKICAIGVKVDAAGVTSHGFALNVSADLGYFGHIVPCGLTDKGVTSLDKLLHREVDMDQVSDVVATRIARRFRLDRANVQESQLEEILANAA